MNKSNFIQKKKKNLKLEKWQMFRVRAFSNLKAITSQLQFIPCRITDLYEKCAKYVT